MYSACGCHRTAGAVLGILCGLLAGTEQAAALDLLDIYRIADQMDPRYLQAQANLEAIQESKIQTRSNLLPQLSLEASASRISQDIEADFPSDLGTTSVSYSNHSYQLLVRQTLFNWDQFKQLKQSDLRVLQATAELQQARQNLVQRVADSYFNILSAEENLNFVRAEQRALKRQLEQTKQRFEVGIGTITDVEEAQAGYDQASAREIQQINELDNARERLQEIIGVYLHESKILDEQMPLRSPQPADIESWTRKAIQGNPRVHAARYMLAQVEFDVDRRTAGHFPVLDLVGTHGTQSTGGRFGDSDTDTSSISLEFKLPLYQGGRTSSQVRQSRQELRSSRQKLEQALREVRRLAREAFWGTNASISRIKALKQAVRSSETALHATRAGFEVGTRTSVDVVRSEQTLSGARRDYAQARYQYVLQHLQLQQAAGTLSEEYLQQVNHWLQSSKPETDSSVEENEEGTKP